MKITNKSYRMFLDSGVINTLSIEDITKAIESIDGIRGDYIQEGKCLLALLYYTGARPNEILKLYGKDIVKEGAFIKVMLPGSKKGLPRVFYLSLNKPYARAVLDYSRGIMPEMLLFHHYRGNRIKTYKTKKGMVSNIDITYKLYNHFKKWFSESNPITPYFLRHNRFSRLSEKGVMPNEIMILKGSKSIESVRPYLHMSTYTAKKLSKKID